MKKSVDVSFSARNFISFTSINTASENSLNLQQLWDSLPDAVKTGDLKEQLQWEGDKKKLMPALKREKLAKASMVLSYVLFALGMTEIAISFFYTSAVFPVIGLCTIASGIILNVLTKLYHLAAPKILVCMHTHGVFVWGEVPHKDKLKKMVAKFSY